MIKFNVFTGNLDLVNKTGAGSSFDSNRILVGPTDCLYAGPTPPIDILIDENGNVLLGDE